MAASRAPHLETVFDVSLDSDSYLGARFNGNVRRLIDVDLEPIIAPFEKRPGQHPWIGEHLGKWMHAAAVTWLSTGNARLAAKLEHAAARLIATQEPDGYLGTYEPGRRLGNYPDADWDVWTHKYCLVGLLAYYEALGNQAALAASVRAADLLLATFGDQPGKRSIVAGAWHQGMAPASVLAPIVDLYGHTGEARFLDFAHYVLRAWDEPGGPQIRTTLLKTGRVSEVGNGKAYEMLSNIVGLLALGRATGDEGHLAAAKAAWDDVVAHHLYATGSASFLEHFNRPDELPDSFSVNVGETCVTVTWLQLSLELLALTGDAKYADEVERTVHNHLLAAQRPDGQAWSYYTPLHGRREYGDGISCCISSGPRGIAEVAPAAIRRSADELVVCLYTPSRARVPLDQGVAEVRLTTEMPWRGGATLTFTQDGPVECALRFRSPAWSTGTVVDGVPAGPDGWVRLSRRAYRRGDEVRVEFDSGPRVVEGHAWNEAKVSMAWGPLVLAHQLDDAPDSALDYLDHSDVPSLSALAPEATWELRNPRSGSVMNRLGPFATAADDVRSCRVWIPREVPDPELSVFHGAAEDQSSGDSSRASFNDYDPYSYVVTAGDEVAWFCLTSAEPVTFSRVDFVHGRSMVHGGWFDTSAAKPQLEVRLSQSGPWVALAQFEDYPTTDVESDSGLQPAERFTVTLSRSVTATAIRVSGAGSWGGYPGTRIATCALLQAYPVLAGHPST